MTNNLRQREYTAEFQITHINTERKTKQFTIMKVITKDLHLLERIPIDNHTQGKNHTADVQIQL
jgi:hypothetical protein